MTSTLHSLLRRRTRAATAVAVVATVALAISGCSGGSGGANHGAAKPSWTMTSQTPKPSGDIASYTWASYAEPFSLDYAYAFDYSDNQVLANVCESLLRLNPDYTLSPGLAESYTHPTPTSWVYKIRSGVTFHDGTLLTPNDAVVSMRRQMDPAVGSSWYSAYQNVKSIEQTGEHDVTVTMKKPDSQFNLSMGSSAGVIESAATLKAKGKSYGNSTGGVNCTGPFSFVNWKAGESITLKRYANYWDPALRAKAGEVKFLFINDSTARINALKSGQVDGGWMVPADGIKDLQSSGAGQVYFGMNTAVGSLIVNNLKGPLGDVRVRKALLMALDRQGIISAAGAGYGEVTNALTTPSVWVGASKDTLGKAFDGLEKYPYDLTAAKKLVEEAGATGKEITYVTAPMGTDFSVISQATAAAAEAIGLKATIKTVTPNAYTTLFADPSARAGADLFYTSWYLSSPDPLEMYGVLRTGEFSNYGNWSNADFDKTVNEAMAIDDPAKRAEKTAEAQKIANDQLPWLPLNTGPMTVFQGKRISGVSPSIAFLYYLGRPPLALVSIRRTARINGGAATVIRRVAGKLGSLLLTLFLASLLVFFSRFLVPGDPVSFLLRGRKPSPEAVADITAQFGLNLPPWQQYLNWIMGVVHGDFGRSLQFRQDVSTVIGDRLPVTFGLVVMAGLMIAAVGLIAGVAAALNRNRALDKAILTGLTVLGAIPSFVGSIVLIAVFAVQLGWFPSFGSGAGFLDTIYHLVLPSLALAIVFVVLVGKVTRSSMVEQLNREHVEVATSRGLGRSTVVRRHVFRNAIGPILTVSGPLVAGLLVASSIVEAAFGISGIGSLLVQSVDRLDFPVVQAIVLLVVTTFVAVNALIDILEPWIDPRSAAGAGAR
ncbi:ABC transporter substrate-binding protein [Arthrobacter sp. ERGS1:01]|uniref:ABC transporter substrate-binding protein n=1 Tax=Arthrobacter sp. ERGS1:01 TaxID=1704044 RepID=UPI000AEAFD09